MRKVLIVGYDDEFKEPVLTVGIKPKDKTVDIINAFLGDEATELYNKLITKSKGMQD